ncbi:PREDICTED: interferon lambda-3-like [Chrysochloris asiatica]|uniref:Interferon lambda-3-like n=1 Tax=Chrysochloris asiatica TaxID=185453 RepID=A0A9B0UF35_CHRAS|nr:PREDICTED: interferon lambda-3-like [Chrysochloris asiatica]
MAVGCLLMLMATLLTMTGAAPTPTPSRALLDTRGCNMAKFKSLSPQELRAFKRAKDALVSLLSVLAHLSSVFSPQVWERPVALEAELALTLKVLGNVDNSALGPILDQPLHTLHHIHSELQACVPPQPTAGPRPQGRLHRWLHRLQEAPRKESQSCLEASVTFNLFRLLIRDLKCVASGDQCV